MLRTRLAQGSLARESQLAHAFPHPLALRRRWSWSAVCVWCRSGRACAGSFGRCWRCPPGAWRARHGRPIAVYQAVKVSLVENGQTLPANAPVSQSVRARSHGVRVPPRAKVPSLVAELRIHAPGRPDVLFQAGPRTIERSTREPIVVLPLGAFGRSGRSREHASRSRFATPAASTRVWSGIRPRAARSI